MNHFTRKICFRDLNDTEIDACFAVNSDGIVRLISCTLGTLLLDAAQVERIMGNDFARQIEAVQEWYSCDGWRGVEAKARGVVV